jgi:hypothetical protein
MTQQTFLLKPEHIKLLEKAYIGWDKTEFGAPAIDPKRPYGNSSVIEDIAEILDWQVDPSTGLTKEQDDYAYQLHKETQTALQIIVQHFKVPWGTYVSDDYGFRWKLKE